MPLVTRDNVETLKTPQLDALLYLKGVTWGPKVGKAPEKRATVWGFCRKIVTLTLR